MASVDDRIVRMEFDNASFERKIGSTITSLGQLEKALKFDAAKQGFSEISSMADKFHLTGMGSAIDGISTKFLALSTIAITALSNIVNKAIDTGLQLAKHLSLDQVISGFKEYEQNMTSIQTILSNTKQDGTNLEDVNGALGTLNEYADKTIYNFGQMTRNIGTFTAAGVDLDTSVQSIKGISNLAAMSGSSADQASSAMYQLSQAVATGSLKLMDWNSVVNAGMGGEVFQKALFETGKAMGTIADVPMGQSFQEWTDSGHSFRESLQEGWVTADVLTTTLQGFTGEMTEAQLTAIGYTQEQAAEIIALGQTGVEAATKVRTLTGLIETTKEAIGSGWSESFKIVFGNFEEATQLFSGASGIIGHIVKTNADARNELLQGWSDLGGRTLLFESIQTALFNLYDIIKPIKEAFHDIFPPLTAERLFEMTQRFSEFAAALKPSGETVEKLKDIFRGLFGALEIGWEIVKEGAKFIGELFTSITGAGSGQFTTFLANIGNFLTELNEKLVAGGGIKQFFVDLKEKITEFFSAASAWVQESGIIPFFIDLKDNLVIFFQEAQRFIDESGIKDFFEDLKDAIKDPAEFVDDLKNNLIELFDNFKPDILEKAGGAFERVGQRFETLKGIFKKAKELWEPFSDALSKVAEVLDDTWEAIKRWFEELGDKIAAVMGPGDFDAAVDAINVGLLGAIAGLIAKFMSDGFNFDIGSGLFDKIGKSFEELTGVLTAMQSSIKADALLKIAGAIALLTASVVVLSLIDSAALTKSLTAMAIGFGQLMASFAILTKMSAGPKSAASLSLLAGGMLLLSGAILILALAAESLSDMDWGELAKGLTGVLALMTIMTGAAVILSQNTGGLVKAGLGMIGIAVALAILAGAMKIFATMSWEDMGKGFTAVAGGLLVIAGALQLMPNGASMALQGVGLMLVATSMAILAGVVKIFADMEWGEMGKGFAAIAGGLLIIAGAMQLMPPTMPLIGAGLLLVSISLIAIAKAMQMMGGLSWSEIGKGLATMAGALLILAAATMAMSGSIVGSIAIGIAAASLLLLAEVLEAFSGMSWGDLIHGLVGIAAILGVLAAAALLLQPAIGPMMLLGAALVLIGAGFALFGFGAQMVATAFEKLAEAGAEGSEALVASLEAIGKALPALATGLAEGLIEFITVIAEFAPVLVKALVEILQHLLEGLAKLIPEVVNVISVLITELLNLITEKYPEFVEAGISLLMSLLQGIRDHIGEVVTLVGEIIVEFLDALSVEVPRIIDSVANLIIQVFEGAAFAAGEVAATMMFGVAIKFIEGFMSGLSNALPGPMSWFMELAGKVLGWIGNVAKTLWEKGIDFIAGLLGGIINKAESVISWFKELAGKVLGWIGSVASTLTNKGIDFIKGLLDGINQKITSVTSFFTGLASAVMGWVGNVAKTLFTKGLGLITGLWDGIKDKWGDVTGWLGGLAGKVLGAVGNLANTLYNIGKDIINGLWNGMKAVWESVSSWLGGIGNAIAGLKGPPKKDKVILVNNGMLIMQGLQRGMEDEWDHVARWLSTVDPASEMDNTMGDRMANVLNAAISTMIDQLETMSDFNPVITPVLDLTRLAEDAKQIGSYIQASEKLSPSYSYTQARTIASSSTEQEDTAIKAPAGSGEVKFEQHIYSPTQLSTSDIYKNTRNQITMAKEELSIP